MKAIRIEKIFAFFMALDPTLCTADTLPGDAPEQTLALVTIGGTGGGPEDEIVGGCTGYGVDQGLEGLLVHVDLLKIWNNNKFELLVSLQYWKSLNILFLPVLHYQGLVLAGQRVQRHFSLLPLSKYCLIFYIFLDKCQFVYETFMIFNLILFNFKVSYLDNLVSVKIQYRYKCKSINVDKRI